MTTNLALPSPASKPCTPESLSIPSLFTHSTRPALQSLHQPTNRPIQPTSPVLRRLQPPCTDHRSTETSNDVFYLREIVAEIKPLVSSDVSFHVTHINTPIFFYGPRRVNRTEYFRNSPARKMCVCESYYTTNHTQREIRGTEGQRKERTCQKFCMPTTKYGLAGTI